MVIIVKKLLFMALDDEILLRFKNDGPFWHLCTPGQLSGILFCAKKDYVYAMNLVALCIAIHCGRVKIYTFQIMSNHFHFVLSGSKENVLLFFNELRRRLHRFFAYRKEAAKMKEFECNLFEVCDLMYLRSVIAYVNRNGFMVNRRVTPFSYQWGANRFMFSQLHLFEQMRPISDVPQRERQRIFHSHFNCFPDSYFFVNDYVSPVCYCKITECESFFFSSHHYFSFLSRRVEAFADIARELGDMITFTDDEIFLAALSYSNKQFNEKSIKSLDKTQKTELAKVLRYNFNGTHKQIARVLNMELRYIEALFPVPIGGK